MSLRSIASVASLIVVLFAQTSSAVLKPLTQAEREANASEIVTGYVTSVKKEIRKTGYGSNMHYTVQMIVTDVAKGNNVHGGETLKFHYWKEYDRPAGWCGDGGQMGTMKMHQIVKAYLTFDEPLNLFTLLNPNGFDLLER